LYIRKRHSKEHQLRDFGHFCTGLNIHEIIAEADANGRVKGREKELYAIAILRAIEHGDFGRDTQRIQEAITSFWERGYRDGFNVQSFNAVFEEFFSAW
jgi:hypothetical protein